MYNKKSKIELKKSLDREDFERLTLSFYKYCLIDSPKYLRNKLYLDLINLEIIGRIYVSKEGINAQVCIPKHNLEVFKSYIHSIDFFSDIKFKHAIEEGTSFSKLKILVRNEIVAYKIPKDSYDMKKIGVHLKPIDFHRSIKEKDSVIVDMRNYYESEVGRFKNAIIPNAHFSKELLPKVAKILIGNEDKKVHLYCTGGIRCEKASSYLKEKGFKNVFHLKGGILKYLETIPINESRWEGECFVFDQRVTVNHNLEKGNFSQCYGCKMPLSKKEVEDKKYIKGVTCKYCFDSLSNDQKKRFSQRQKQIELSLSRGEAHIGQTKKIK